MYLQEHMFFKKSSKTTENLVFENKYTYKYAYTHQFTSIGKDKKIVFPLPLLFQLKKMDVLDVWELKKKVAFFLTALFPLFLQKSQD